MREGAPARRMRRSGEEWARGAHGVASSRRSGDNARPCGRRGSSMGDDAVQRRRPRRAAARLDGRQDMRSAVGGRRLWRWKWWRKSGGGRRPKSEAMFRIEQVYPELEIPANGYHEVSWIESFTRLAGLYSVTQMKDRLFKYDDRGFTAKSDLLKSPLSLKAITGVLERLLKEPRGFVVFNGFNGMMGKISREESPFPHRKGTLMMVEYIVAWNMDEDLESHKFSSWLNELMSMLVSLL
ncbi:hypothetical protein Syun_031682 [Stephania yunnanensis]|uniref:Uncharacterized protein n=1 Tax=Stephania yunnanensis TaxID=152371 RepID=A0AAP0E2J2_9MAGN